MEESEKRRERLKAMRIEAQGVKADVGSTGSEPHGLCNPLIESEASSKPPQYTSPRFDFYTDPMSAFSTNKRRNNINPQVSQGYTYPRPMYPDTDCPPTYPNPAIRSPHERMIQTPAVNYNQRPTSSAIEAAYPLGTPQRNPPSVWGGSSAAVNFNYPPNISQAGGNYVNSGFGQVDSPYSNYSRGRGNRYNSGRGRGQLQGNRMSPGSGEVRPKVYYRKEMLEDPWKMLSPVISKVFDSMASNKSWRSKPIHSKKAKVSSEASQRSTPQRSTHPSLSEYLASSFNQSATEDAAAEP